MIGTSNLCDLSIGLISFADIQVFVPRKTPALTQLSGKKTLSRRANWRSAIVLAGENADDSLEPYTIYLLYWAMLAAFYANVFHDSPASSSAMSGAFPKRRSASH